MNPRSTAEVAELVGIAEVTLERWLAEGKVPMPKTIQIGTRRFRIWTAKDVERVDQYKAKFYRKGRGRKKGPGR
jgi:excisionase family DNA binding protein